MITHRTDGRLIARLRGNCVDPLRSESASGFLGPTPDTCQSAEHMLEARREEVLGCRASKRSACTFHASVYTTKFCTASTMVSSQPVLVPAARQDFVDP